ncbi:MAG: alpha/beta hydrolase [Desulforegulaceae bacterium]|nr:alpha/beta hydrolase [Desulforegulaceae bacterium]
MIAKSKFKYLPSEKFLEIKEKIIRWKKFLSYYENGSYNIKEIRKNALIAAKNIKNNTPGNVFKFSNSRLEWVRESSQNSKVNILYIHGGGFIAGSLDNHRPFAKILSKKLNANVLMVDYPLAPENKYPTQLNEVLKSFEFMKENSSKFFFNGILGDSAGANLGLAAILELNKNQRLKPDFGIFLSGFFDLCLKNTSIEENKIKDFVLTREFLEFCVKSYSGEGKKLKKSSLSPVYGDFNSSCDLFFQVGTEEILMEDSINCHNKAVESNVDSTLSIWPLMMHSFQSYYSCFPEADFAIRELSAFIEKSISKPG